MRWVVLVIIYLLLKVSVVVVWVVLLHQFRYCSKVLGLKESHPRFDPEETPLQKANLWVQGQFDPVCSSSPFCDFHQLWRRPAVARPALKAAAELNAAARLQCRAEILPGIFVGPPTFAPTFTGCLSARRTDGPYQ